MKYTILVILSAALGVGESAFAREAILEQVLRQAASWRVQGVQPVVVMDLDETTVDSIPRRFASLQGALPAACVGVAHRLDCDRLEKVKLRDLYELKNRYDFSELLVAAQVAPSSWSSDLEKAMVSEYLSGAHIELDRAVPGADHFIDELHTSGAKIVYVTSRFEDVQGAPTRRSLEVLGYMNPAQLSELFLRTRGQSSIDFKQKTYETIQQEVTTSPTPAAVLAVFENEPENMMALASHFPEALRVFVLGAMIKAGALPEVTTHIQNYL